MSLNKKISRRNFLKGMAAGTAGVAMAGVLGACSSGSSGSSGSSSSGSTNSIAGTEGPYGLVYADAQELNLVYTSELTTLHPFVGTGANDWEGISNCVSGLMTTDCYGNYVPDMAESYEVSDDGMVYTFHLRDDMHYADVDGNDMGQITAQDFVTASQWICDPANASGQSYYYEEIIAGASELVAGEEPDPETLGFKALDDLTVEITLAAPIPYFLSYCGSYMPVPTALFEEQGENYGLDNDTIYYYGPYILKTYEPQSRRIYEKNPVYWDADDVYIDKITKTYNSEGNTLAPEMFTRGEVDYASIGTDILDEWMSNDDTKDIVVPALPDTTYMYYYSFCYWPRFDDKYEPDNYKIAIDNENFRQSLYWGLNREKAQLTHDPYYPDQYLTNSVTPRTWCSVDGVDFVDIGDMQEITARENWSFDEEKALAYKEAAVAELSENPDFHFPVILYMSYNPTSNGWEQEVQVVKQQLEDLLGSDYINCVIESGPSTNFLAEIRRTGSYGFMKLNNGSTAPDPVAWITAFAEGGTWNFMNQAAFGDSEWDEADWAASYPNLRPVLEEYYALVDDAKSVPTKTMERYEKFATAEAYLLNHALVIPCWTDSSGYRVTRYNPLEGIYGSDGRFKYIKVLSEPLKASIYEQLYADWQEEQAASMVD